MECEEMAYGRYVSDDSVICDLWVDLMRLFLNIRMNNKRHYLGNEWKKKQHKKHKFDETGNETK